MNANKFFLFLLIISLFIFSSCGSPSHYNEFIDTSFTESSNICLIDLRGEVMYPGIYQVKEGTLIIDIIELAGGFTKEANITNINLVNTVTSNTKLVIPSIDDNIQDDSLININNASLSELMKLPKIGESKAKAIIEYRTTHGEFKNIEELKQVSGIGDALYEAIKTYITV